MTLNRTYTDKQLAQAKAKREARLARLTELVAVCVCCWPIINYRNVSGHDGGCPAHKLIMDKHYEDQED